MQGAYYGTPTLPRLEDAKTLYDWAIEGLNEKDRLQELTNGPRVVIQGVAPTSHR